MADAAQAWQKASRSWNRLAVNEEGRLYQIDTDDALWDEAAHRRFALRNKARGLIRSIVIVLDLSEHGLEPRDFGTHRGRFLISVLGPFLTDFFDRNPVSQVAIVATYNGFGHVLSPLSGSLSAHLQCIEHLMDGPQGGEASLQNAISCAGVVLKSAPRYSTKEVLVIYGSLNTNDVMPIDSTISRLKSMHVVVSVIGMGAALFVLRKLAEDTGGSYLVPMNADHFDNILRANLEPPEWAEGHERLEMVRFGYAKSSDGVMAFDPAELRSDKNAMPHDGAFLCPQCGIRVFVIPVYCPSCGLLLLTPAHVTRCLIHLHPVDPFMPVEEHVQCCGCGSTIEEDQMLRCNECGSLFCSGCDDFVHNMLHQCPVCLAMTS